MPLQFSRAPFVAISGGLCGGILLFFRAGVGAEIGLVILLVGALLFWLLERRPLPYGGRSLHWLPLIVCSLAIGIGAASLHPRLSPEAIPGGGIARGVVTDTAATSYGHRLEVRLTGLKEIEGGKAFIYTDTPCAPGDIVSYPASFAQPAGAPDYRSWLFSRGIDLVSYPSEVVVSGHTFLLPAYFRALRNRLADKIHRSRLTPGAAAFLSALLVGERSGLDPELRQEFAGAGIAHVLAVSGLHVGIVVLLLGALLLPFDLTGSRLPRYLLTIAGIWLFALLSGAGAPVVRASIMATCVLIALLLQRPGIALNSLCLAAFLILIFSPRALFDAGFLLSFAVTAAILFLLPRFKEKSWLSVIGVYILLPCVAFLSSWMLTARYFHSVTLLFLPLNLLLAPLLPLYFGLGAFYLLLLWIGVDAGWIAWLLNEGYGGLAAMAGAVSRLPEAAIAVWLPELPAWLYGAGLILFALWLRMRLRWQWLTACGCIALSIAAILILPPSLPPDSLQVSGRREECKIASTHNGRTEYATLSADTLSAITLHGRRIVYADAPVRENNPQRRHLKTDMLIIGRSYKGSISPLIDALHPDSIHLLPSLYPSRRAELLEEITLGL